MPRSQLIDPLIVRTDTDKRADYCDGHGPTKDSLRSIIIYDWQQL